MKATAVRAEEAALQAKTAAGAYEAAFAATVPPPVVAANRTLLASLIATNFLGQNAPAIAATEAHYAGMWAQDAAAMYAYASSSAAATQLTPFAAPPETTRASREVSQSAAATNPTQSSVGSSVQSSLSDLISQVPNALQSVTTNPTGLSAAISSGISQGAGDIQSILKTGSGVISTVAGPYGPLGLGGAVRSWWQMSISIPSLGTALQGLGPTLSPKVITGALTPLLSSELLTGSQTLQSAVPSTGVVSGAVGHGGLIGSLSVPTNWATAVPAVKAIATELPATVLETASAIATNGGSGLFGEMALSSLAGRALGAPASQAIGAVATRAIGAVTQITNTVVAQDIATTATIIVIPPIEK